MTEPGPWGDPTEHVDLYPGITVWDERKSGSLTSGSTRLPLWAFSHEAICGDTDGVWAAYEPSLSQEEFAAFVTDLLQARGCFARLLAVLADAQRNDRHRSSGGAWWATKRHRKRVTAALNDCIDALTEGNTQ